MRVLLAEDDPMIGASIRQGLRQDGFAVDWAEDGRAAELALAEHVHDALVLDLGLPKRSGLELLGAMRRRGDARPVLILTARDAVADRIAGLDTGADDYMVKPFDLDELSARLRALLRRSSGRSAPVVVLATRIRSARSPARTAGSDPVARPTRGQALRLERCGGEQRSRGAHSRPAAQARRRLHPQRPRRGLDGRAAGGTPMSEA
jgi:two-component system response regulator QseB